MISAKEVEGNEGMGVGGRGGSYICEKNIKNVLGKVLYINYPLLSMKPFFLVLRQCKNAKNFLKIKYQN